MRRILVTGANKGIGLAIVQGILERHDDTFVYLGARAIERGQAAATSLPKGRVEVVPLDVGDEGSVAAARDRVAAHLGGEKLYGLVNNAGIGAAGAGGVRGVLEVNTFGVRRVTEAFLPLLDPARGRVVLVTSASGPSFVATCSPEQQEFLVRRENTWPELAKFIEERVAAGTDDAYGLSKACTNAYMRIVARAHPELAVNACTPGFIATDMTRHYADAQNKSPAELGMKPPSAGAVAPLHLLFDALEGNGRYYGSDAKRSPLDRYRAPGSPEYAGA